MNYPIVVCLVAIEALNLALLWVALRSRISRVARPLVACCGLSGAWGAWMLAIVVHWPVGMMGLTIAVFALSSIAMGVAIHLATREEADRDDGGAGGAPILSPQAPDDDGGDEPPWWPEFEQQVASYAARRHRERQPVDC
jgi:hypothetical protein